MSSVYLESKPRYEILDGLRGVAAMLVVAYHMCETHFGLTPAHPINHGHLAVDFFFALSGFVVGYAYDDRWDRMSTWGFFKRRLIRLHPLVVLGTLFGMCMFYLTACDEFPLVAQTPWYVLVGITLLCFTMIPLPSSMDIRGWGETNPLDGPAWSLQWEYLGNILYATIFRRLPRWALACCVAIFAVLTVMLCLNIDAFGLLASRTDLSYTVIGGWSLDPDQLLIGFTRLAYQFFGGLLLSKLGWLIRVRHAFWWCSLMVVAVLCMPWMGLGTEGASRWTNGLYEAVCILVMFPLIVSMGAGSSVRGAASAVNKFLGDISYPLYITHFPYVQLQIAWVRNHPDASASTHFFMGICLFLLAIGTAWAAFRLYDLPVRDWLKRKLFKVKHNICSQKDIPLAG